MGTHLLRAYLSSESTRKIKPAIKARILQEFNSVQSVLRAPDLLEQVLGNAELSRRIWLELLDLRLSHVFDDESPRFLGCSCIAQAHWCDLKAIFTSLCKEYGFKAAYDQDVLLQGERPTIEDYNRLLSERLAHADNVGFTLEAIETSRGRVSWDWETGRIVQEGIPDPRIRGELIEAHRAEQYPQIRFHFGFMDKIIIGVPDGITDEFCYEFKSTQNEFLHWYVLPVAKSQASLYAYFLKRPRIRIQIHILDTDEVKTVVQEADYAQTEAELTRFVELLSGQREAIPPRRWKCGKCEFQKYCNVSR